MLEQIPSHLKKYIVDQSEYPYTALEHATWRYILAQLTAFLYEHAHPSYREGIKATGISLDHIPSIAEMSRHLEKLGWRAVPVSGFIPPAAFMELQSLGILPIAREMRTFEHMMYTPAPDIVHEAAGHAPMLVNREYSEYLKEYAQVSRKAIISKQDLEVYRAIRLLSDLKENPLATPEQVAEAHEKLLQAQKAVSFVSEAALLARMNWWTAEYGLIGDLKNPKIYGAGLLSSVGESQSCLTDKVRKIPLTLDCINYSYDITEPQPQLFVTPSFEHLRIVLRELQQTMSFVSGGIRGLTRALQSELVNTVELDSGVQISGILVDFFISPTNQVTFLKFQGPAQICYRNEELPDQGCDVHGEGFSSPLGLTRFNDIPLHLWEESDWIRFGFTPEKRVTIEYLNGFILEGEVVRRWLSPTGKTLIVRLKQARLTRFDQVYFDPGWGFFDLVLGTQVTSVFGGAADREKFIDNDDFEAVKVKKDLPPKEKERVYFFEKLWELKNNQNHPKVKAALNQLVADYKNKFGLDPLIEWELRHCNLDQ
ncbi:MAG: aromatic amino acid hydroxylase [Bdellovibrionaceae bacterium]|nr:aromatic amino acid hydroxylase [Pseudobdellovibrionaceae bacterium]MDW8189927.1 aromatic amino acid hydroxylase [Pseudobdellovibrionaceae bacterium]